MFYIARMYLALKGHRMVFVVLWSVFYMFSMFQCLKKDLAKKSCLSSIAGNLGILSDPTGFTACSTGTLFWVTGVTHFVDITNYFKFQMFAFRHADVIRLNVSHGHS